MTSLEELHNLLDSDPMGVSMHADGRVAFQDEDRYPLVSTKGPDSDTETLQKPERGSFVRAFCSGGRLFVDHIEVVPEGSVTTQPVTNPDEALLGKLLAVVRARANDELKV